MKDDKYVLMNMSDSRSKKIGEVLGNKTCKKILDYLSDNDEKSEDDISRALDLKLNTVEYNVKKLLSAGLIEKNKNFFWSRKGKRIVLYSVAKKHIVISPKNMKISPAALKGVIGVFGLVLVGALIMGLLSQGPISEQESFGYNKFESFDDLVLFLEENSLGDGGYNELFGDTVALTGAPEAAEASFDSSGSRGGDDFSTTNIQVEGVDEADILKSDGQYFYVVNANKVVIVNAVPGSDMEIESEIEFDHEQESVGQIYINGDKLVVFTSSYKQGEEIDVGRCFEGDCPLAPYYYEQITNVYVYDILEKADPKKLEDFSSSGYYVNSRMIGESVYLITSQHIYDRENPVLPIVSKGGEEEVIEPSRISSFPMKDNVFSYTIISSINLNNFDSEEEVFVGGSSQNIFVSKENIYTTYTKHRSWWASDTDESEESDEIEEDSLKTIINRFSINKGRVKYEATGEVPGRVLNQFSMDEFEGNFRIATTIPTDWGTRPVAINPGVGIVVDENNEPDPSLNNLYVLDMGMEVVGAIEGLAPGESIYSARFIGEKAYMVTFRKIDPLFVLDLSDPSDPKVLGKLKIPGYSDYLHPIDENHIIGLGKDAIGSEEGDFAWYQGLKMAVFDVSDVENPIELHKIEIGDRGTNSVALYDHKAFLFDEKRELLVIPVTLAEFESEPENDWDWGTYTFQGSYVFDLSVEDGFDLRGAITHYSEEDVQRMGHYFYGSKSIFRNAYIGDTLYTFSNDQIGANNLLDLERIGGVDLPYEQNYYPYLEEDVAVF